MDRGAGGLQSLESKLVGDDWAADTFTVCKRQAVSIQAY